MGNAVFGVGCVFLIAICVPFLYYSYLSYEWGMAHKPAGYRYPEFKNFKITAIGTVYFFI